MSSFNAPTKHPVTGKVEKALWLDDYFGRHQYGVRFPSGETVYDVRRYPDMKPLRDDIVMGPVCTRCGSIRVTENWQPGMLECLECGSIGKKPADPA